ncbi:hypothetical protein PG993_007411, partial [Apiospora rasikravindrae]
MASPSPVDENANTAPRLQLILIKKGKAEEFIIGSQVFKSLLNTASISAGGLWLLLQDWKSLHPMHKSGFHENHFVGHSYYTMAWSFDRRNLCTKVIWFNLRFDDVREDFTLLLKRFKNYISSPLLLRFIYCLGATPMVFSVYSVYAVEQRIGFSGYRDIDQDETKPSRLDLSELSRHISRIHDHLAVVQFRQATTNNSIQLLSNLEAQAREVSLQEVISDHTKQKMQSTTHTDIHVGSESSSPIGHPQLFILLTHEDALKGADVAKLGAEIAAASKRDSASMKAVAVLTMAFLPARFFAALFALPSLDWKGAAESGRSVIQSNFWVYWAFTLPAMVLVFVVWIVLNKWAWLMGVYRERVLGMKRGRESETSSCEDDDETGYFDD